jgi:hypothetical protein
MWRLRNVIAPIRRRFIRMETKMQRRFTKAVRGGLLPVIAVLTLFAAIPAAQAQSDRQATSAQMDNALNWGVVRGTGMSGAYAQAGHPYVHRRGHR